MLATLLLSRGVPMLLGGDEFGRTQRGNNNAYRQHNEVSRYDWRLLERNRELFRFVRGLIAFRKQHAVLHADAFYSADELDWFGQAGQPADWDGPTRALGCLVHMQEGASVGGLRLLFNARQKQVAFDLPPPPAGPWRVSLDTSNPAPGDIFSPGQEPCAPGTRWHHIAPQTLLVLSSA